MALVKTKPSIIKLLYQLMYDVHNILEDEELTYWIICGTLLGAVRNRGIIKWDDDLDIGMFFKDRERIKKLAPKLKRCGYGLVKISFGYKIFYLNRKNIEGEKFSFPNLDIFLFDKNGDRYVYHYKSARDEWPKEWIEKDAVDNLKLVEFGIFDVWAPMSKKYLPRAYGKDWNRVAWRTYDHATETEVKKVKIKLTKDDREPAEPFDKIKDTAY